jgi:hypothetical protein
MKIWRVESKWSKELVIADNTMEARKKYMVLAKKEIADFTPAYRANPEPTEIVLLGDAI